MLLYVDETVRTWFSRYVLYEKEAHYDCKVKSNIAEDEPDGNRGVNQL